MFRIFGVVHKIPNSFVYLADTWLVGVRLFVSLSAVRISSRIVLCHNCCWRSHTVSSSLVHHKMGTMSRLSYTVAIRPYRMRTIKQIKFIAFTKHTNNARWNDRFCKYSLMWNIFAIQLIDRVHTEYEHQHRFNSLDRFNSFNISIIYMTFNIMYWFWCCSWDARSHTQSRLRSFKLSKSSGDKLSKGKHKQYRINRSILWDGSMTILNVILLSIDGDDISFLKCFCPHGRYPMDRTHSRHV